MADIQKKLGARIRYFRSKNSMSQEDMAFKCGLHRTYISDIERGVRNLSLKNIEIIAKVLNIEMSELFSGI